MTSDFQIANRLAAERKYQEAYDLFVRYAEMHPEEAAKV
jgi:hypothetical protein